MKFSKRILNWLIIVYMSTIMALSAAMINTKTSLNKTYVLSLRLDYLLHALQFIPWMILIRWRWRNCPPSDKAGWKEKKGAGFFLLALGAGLLLAVISEGAQYMLPYRSFNVFDLLSNFVGLAVGALIAGWGRGAKRQARQKTL